MTVSARLSVYTSVCVFVCVFAVGSRLTANFSSSSLIAAGDNSDDDRGIEFEANCKIHLLSCVGLVCIILLVCGIESFPSLNLS